MTHTNSMFSLVFGLLSAAILAGCGGAAAEGQGAGGAAEKHDGYGYEMLPLTLSAGPAPQGEALTPNGRVAPEEVQRQAMAKIPEIRKCYDAALGKTPGLTAKVVVKMHFEASGALTSSTVEDPKPADAELGECVAKTLGSMTIPAAKEGPMEVIYPVELSPEPAAKP